MDVLLIYQFCIFGGVERAVLNRATTFKNHGMRVKIHVGFLQDVQGALRSFTAYIRGHELEEYVSAFLLSGDSFPDPDTYDLVLNIDTPQVFDRTSEADNLYLECHTPYVENRQYLQSLPPNIRGVLVPSEAFRALLLSEWTDLPPVFVVPNPVANEFFHVPRSAVGRAYPKAPLTYLARLNDLKNIREAIGIFSRFADDEHTMFAVVGKGAEEGALLADLEKKRILGKTLLRDKLDYGDVPAFIGMVRDHRGIFLSPSKGESFGLSAAEFISAGVPVLLSDIPPHRELVENDERHLYTLGDLSSAEKKIVWITAHWEAAGKNMIRYGRKFKGAAFLKAWRGFIASMS